MNTEYAKFNQPRAEYIPPISTPGYFSHLPDVLVPSQHKELAVNPIEREEIDVLRDTSTPPPTPPELTPGQAGCNVFKEAAYYVDPIFKDPAYLRKFRAKLMLLDVGSLLPCTILLITICAWRKSDLVILLYQSQILFLSILGILLAIFFVYAVSLFRNPPFNYLAYGARTIIVILLVGLGSLNVHTLFLKTQLEVDETKRKYDSDFLDMVNKHSPDLLENLNGSTSEEDSNPWDLIDGAFYEPEYSPPYMTLVGLVMVYAGEGLIMVLSFKFEIEASDFRIPVTIYAFTFSLCSVLITLILSNVFGTISQGYDLFQVTLGCYMETLIIIRTPIFHARLFGGKLCPLRKDELFYASIHYGM